ncbi:MAG: alpha/beta fold hydrolase [Planctomycetota bacterium]
MRLLRLVALLLPVAARAEEEKPQRAEPGPGAPAGRALEWTSPGGRPFWYRLPARPSGRPNLLLMLHGSGMTFGWAFWNYPIASGEFRPGDIVIAPESDKPDRGFFQSKPDAEEVASLIQLFRKRLPIANVYLYGHSQGAFFAYWFAGERPELVDGIVAHAGNVLANVKHPKAAKEKLAVGILHGRADSVVTADCAYATDLFYAEQGYRKVRLKIVEGLDERSGHWPLPGEASRMLDWLDGVSLKDAGDAASFALREIAKERPDLRAVADAVAEGRALLKKQKEDRDAALGKLDALAELLDKLEAEHARALTDAMSGKVPAFGSWASHFRIANAAFHRSPAWQAACKPLQGAVKAQEKAVADAFDQLGRRTKKTFSACVAALEKGFLASGYDRLLLHVDRIAEKPGDLATEEEVAAYRDRIGARKAAEEEGAGAAAETGAAILAEFRGKQAG